MSLPRRKVRYFLSYAHADSADVTRLLDVIDPYFTASTDFHFERWSDHQIRLGKPWRGEIDHALEQCDFGLMLVSPRFVASTFIGEKEVPPLLRKSIVIPVALHEVPLDGSVRLWGLDDLQLFFHKNQPFDAFDHPRDQRAFAKDLFGRLRQELQAAVPAAPAASTPKPEPPATPPPAAPVRRPVPPKPPSELDALLVELAQPATTHQRRQAIGDRLAELGDPRPGTGVINGVPDILWRSIPGGEVVIEERGSVKVEPFHIAAYPITAAQFQAFRPKHQQKTPANHPAIEVSWRDATKFCQWLSEKVGYEVRLPDEQEWQWAAQSAQKDYAYPWGTKWQDGFANTSEANLNTTTAVGVYPQGDSQQRVSDLVGNVWEWCRNLDTSGDLCLRGGHWDYSREDARAGYRGYSADPGVRSNIIGFRVVCSAPIR